MWIILGVIAIVQIGGMLLAHDTFVREIQLNRIGPQHAWKFYAFTSLFWFPLFVLMIIYVARSGFKQALNRLLLPYRKNNDC